uniref:Uncharacterized protein MANES_09G088500 n=1 Tax=Rhizophora mucronata TaxID=61149 RepID=A0A2P2JNR0_RHIMU
MEVISECPFFSAASKAVSPDLLIAVLLTPLCSSSFLTIRALPFRAAICNAVLPLPSTMFIKEEFDIISPSTSSTFCPLTAIWRAV